VQWQHDLILFVYQMRLWLPERNVPHTPSFVDSRHILEVIFRGEVHGLRADINDLRGQINDLNIQQHQTEACLEAHFQDLNLQIAAN
jgi:hypothetical protein